MHRSHNRQALCSKCESCLFQIDHAGRAAGAPQRGRGRRRTILTLPVCPVLSVAIHLRRPPAEQDALCCCHQKTGRAPLCSRVSRTSSSASGANPFDIKCHIFFFKLDGLRFRQRGEPIRRDEKGHDRLQLTWPVPAL